MGNACLRDKNSTSSLKDLKARPQPLVRLNVYDLGTSGKIKLANSLLRPLGGGIFHCGVEVNGLEWSYSDVLSPDGVQVETTGVFSCTPTRCEGHTFCESIAMGTTTMQPDQVISLVASLEPEWPAASYDTLSHNCCHFCDTFLARLGVGHVPAWVMNLASAGDAVVSGSCCTRGGPSLSTMLRCCGSDPALAVKEETEVLVDVTSFPALHATAEVDVGRPGPAAIVRGRRPLDARL